MIPRSLLARSFAITALALLAACGSAGTSDTEGAPETGDDNQSLSGSASSGATLVTTTSVNFRSGPSTSKSIIDVLPSGTHVTVVDSAPSGGFYHVKHDGATGWVYGAYLAAASSGGSSSNCGTLHFPSASIPTVADAAMTAQYAALGTSCSIPKCFIDTSKVDVNTQLSPSFTLHELVASEIDGGYGTKVLVDPALVSHLQSLRDHHGSAVSITSGFRSPNHQHAVCQSICGANQCSSGGVVTCAKNSRHMWGAAADMSLAYESAANQASFPFVFHENGGTGAHLHVDMQSCN